MKYLSYYKSPIGILRVTADNKKILATDFVSAKGGLKKKIQSNKNNALTKQCVIQLREYFNHKRTKFNLPLELDGTAWQKKVWQALIKIPHGSIISYGDLAKMVGNPKAARAIGGSVHKNKISIIIPCHRVIGSRGHLVGYAGGLWRKKWLLDFEQ